MFNNPLKAHSICKCTRKVKVLCVSCMTYWPSLRKIRRERSPPSNPTTRAAFKYSPSQKGAQCHSATPETLAVRLSQQKQVEKSNIKENSENNLLPAEVRGIISMRPQHCFLHLHQHAGAWPTMKSVAAVDGYTAPVRNCSEGYLSSPEIGRNMTQRKLHLLEH